MIRTDVYPLHYSSFLYIRIRQKPKHYAAALGQDVHGPVRWEDALDAFVQVG